jgi:hypothetical protein
MPHLPQKRHVLQNATSDRTAMSAALDLATPILSDQFIRRLRKRNPSLAKAS